MENNWIDKNTFETNRAWRNWKEYSHYITRGHGFDNKEQELQVFELFKEKHNEDYNKLKDFFYDEYGDPYLSL